MKFKLLVSVFAGLSLAGCAATTPGSPPAAVTPSQVVTYVSTFAQGLHTALPLLVAPVANPGIPLATEQKIEPLIADIQTAAAALATTDATQTQTPQQIVQRISNDFGAVVAALTAAGVTIPSQAQPYIIAAEVLLPTIEQLVGLPAPVGASPSTSGWTVQDALNQLRKPATH